MQYRRQNQIPFCWILFLVISVLAGCSTTPPKPVVETTVEPSATQIVSTSEPETMAEDLTPSGGDAADIAVQAAQQFSGRTLRISYEAGLQALDGYFFGPEWTRLTGIDVEVVEYGFEELYDNTLANPDKIEIVSQLCA